jgi:hypothetical protein
MSDVIEGFMREWSKHENASRTSCAECHFESSDGYPPAHAPGCSQLVRQKDHEV